MGTRTGQNINLMGNRNNWKNISLHCCARAFVAIPTSRDRAPTSAGSHWKPIDIAPQYLKINGKSLLFPWHSNDSTLKLSFFVFTEAQAISIKALLCQNGEIE